MNKIAFVTGGSGFIAKYLIQRLLLEKFTIRVLVRPTSKIDHLVNHDVEIIEGDITIPESYSTSLEGINYIFNLAGVVTDWAPKKDYHDVHVTGVQNLLELAIKNNVRRLIHISTIDVMKKNDDQNGH